MQSLLAFLGISPNVLPQTAFLELSAFNNCLRVKSSSLVGFSLSLSASSASLNLNARFDSSVS